MHLFCHSPPRYLLIQMIWRIWTILQTADEMISDSLTNMTYSDQILRVKSGHRSHKLKTI